MLKPFLNATKLGVTLSLQWNYNFKCGFHTW